MRPAEAWKRDAVCNKPEVDTNLFFPEYSQGRPGAQSDTESAAKERCATCPVVEECLDYALLYQIPDGIFGNMNPRERRIEKAARKRARFEASR